MAKSEENLKPNIIIVDDDELVLQSIRLVIEEFGAITTCLDPVEALKKINSQNFDILISDYNMPKLSGINLIKGAIQINPDILPIIITGYANKDTTLEALKNGAYDFIEKPIIPEILYASINRAWGKIKILKHNKNLLEEIKIYSEKLEEKNDHLNIKNQELLETQRALKSNNEKLEVQNIELQNAQAKVLQSALKAGMTEVATNILHNVGNILNSINVSTNFLRETLNNSKVEILINIINLIKENENNLAEFLFKDEKGKLIPVFLNELKDALREESKSAQQEIHRLISNLEHIKTIINFQQNFAKQPIRKEEFTLNSIIENALTILEHELKSSAIKVSYDKNAVASIVLSKHKLLHILLNLIRNAKDSLLESNTIDKEIKIIINLNPLQLIIEDNGIGIEKENIENIFNHGFTTKKTGHGFGLHSSALTIKELGCQISAESDGFGKGARFIITFPIFEMKDITR